MPRINVRLPAPLLAAARRKAEAHRQSMSDYVRALIHRDLAKNGKWWGSR